VSKRVDRALDALDRGVEHDVKAQELLRLVANDLAQIEEDLRDNG